VADPDAPAVSAHGRVFITPEWVAILDFETRFPSALEKAMKQGAGT